VRQVVVDPAVRVERTAGEVVAEHFLERGTVEPLTVETEGMAHESSL
jgi:hypothetical protein